MFDSQEKSTKEKWISHGVLIFGFSTCPFSLVPRHPLRRADQAFNSPYTMVSMVHLAQNATSSSNRLAAPADGSSSAGIGT